MDIGCVVYQAKKCKNA